MLLCFDQLPIMFGNARGVHNEGKLASSSLVDLESVRIVDETIILRGDTEASCCQVLS